MNIDDLDWKPLEEFAVPYTVVATSSVPEIMLEQVRGMVGTASCRVYETDQGTFWHVFRDFIHGWLFDEEGNKPFANATISGLYDIGELLALQGEKSLFTLEGEELYFDIFLNYAHKNIKKVALFEDEYFVRGNPTEMYNREGLVFNDEDFDIYREVDKRLFDKYYSFFPGVLAHASNQVVREYQETAHHFMQQGQLEFFLDSITTLFSDGAFEVAR